MQVPPLAEALDRTLERPETPADLKGELVDLLDLTPAAATAESQPAPQDAAETRRETDAPATENCSGSQPNDEPEPQHQSAAAESCTASQDVDETSTATAVPATAIFAGSPQIAVPGPQPHSQDDPGSTCERSTPPPGWSLMSPSAAKLVVTLGYLGIQGQATALKLATVAGLSERTVRSAFCELEVLGLLETTGRRGQGLGWTLHPVPETLPRTAVDYFTEKLKKKGQGIKRRQDELKEARKAIREAADGQDQVRFSELAKEIATAGTPLVDGEPENDEEASSAA